MMRVTSARVIKAIETIAKATEGAYLAQAGGSRLKESGTRYVAAAQQIVYDSALGENRDALAFFLGVMDGYGILTGEWAEWRDALNADEYSKHFDNGREDARQMKNAAARKRAEAAAKVLRAAGYPQAVGNRVEGFEASTYGNAVTVEHVRDGVAVKGAGELLDYANALEAAGYTGLDGSQVPTVERANSTHTTRVVAIPPTEAERDKQTIRDESLPIEERRAAFRRHNRRHTAQEETTMSEPRHVESSSQDLTAEDAYDGTNWPTHSLSASILNNSKIIENARNYARMDATGAEVRDYLYLLLFERGSLVTEERRRLTLTDAHDLDNARDDLGREIDGTTPRQGFERIDWKRVAADLLAE